MTQQRGFLAFLASSRRSYEAAVKQKLVPEAQEEEEACEPEVESQEGEIEMPLQDEAPANVERSSLEREEVVPVAEAPPRAAPATEAEEEPEPEAEEYFDLLKMKPVVQARVEGDEVEPAEASPLQEAPEEMEAEAEEEEPEEKEPEEQEEQPMTAVVREVEAQLAQEDEALLEPLEAPLQEDLEESEGEVEGWAQRKKRLESQLFSRKRKKLEGWPKEAKRELKREPVIKREPGARGLLKRRRIGESPASEEPESPPQGRRMSGLPRADLLRMAGHLERRYLSDTVVVSA